MPFKRIDFSHRVHLTERMEEPCRYGELRDCLRDLERVNALLAGYTPSLRWIEAYLQRHAGQRVHILDVGSGGGGLLRAIEAWAVSRGHALELTGIDLDPAAARASREFTPAGSSIQWVTGNLFEYKAAAPVDLVVSSLFTHHLADSDIVRFLTWMEQNAAGGWFINDLHRSEKSYYAFKALSFVMRWHPFVQHDGPVSIRRAFMREDWRSLCQEAGLQESDVRMEGKPFGRLCVSRLKS